ncbi:CoA pyrophosphatase [Psychromonas sp. RZ22]|uniref:CoA pyrophosphatase n=1 Tax=Psychromonas algarum TaxID=2555643 RepID=UPI00106723E7|nr:CoA pyrophosphatase [Psychromonas sp. RZ22]TEW53276.1 CoA pyrophosphatase [Psychromonas sp. RZ22]
MNKQHFLNRFILQQTRSTILSPHLLSQQNKTFKKAAILMPIVQRESGLQIILTQRALHLKHHAGQVSFPGGKYELSDNSLALTALRETEEEIGIDKNKIQLIGNLSPLITTTGYHITPFIGFVDNAHKIVIDQGEVKECFEVPFSFALNRNNFSKQHLIANRKRHFTYCSVYQNHLIWGATAQMLINLQQHLRS